MLLTLLVHVTVLVCVDDVANLRSLAWTTARWLTSRSGLASCGTMASALPVSSSSSSPRPAIAPSPFTSMWQGLSREHIMSVATDWFPNRSLYEQCSFIQLRGNWRSPHAFLVTATPGMCCGVVNEWGELHMLLNWRWMRPSEATSL